MTELFLNIILLRTSLNVYACSLEELWSMAFIKSFSECDLVIRKDRRVRILLDEISIDE